MRVFTYRFAFLLLTATVLFYSGAAHGQERNDSLIVRILKISYRPATIQLNSEDGKIYSSVSSASGMRVFKKFTPGLYRLQVSGIGKPAQLEESIYIKQGQDLLLDIKMDGPCLFDRPVDYVPVCPENHKDSIVPIVYGLYIGKAEDLASSKVHLGGCVVTGCDPQFYCNIHKIKF